MKISISPLQHKPYDNYSVLSATGHLMFRCNQSRANWYLDKNLAVLISQEPLVIQLPWCYKKGRSGDDFNLQARQNICVCCGSTNQLSKHHIVPDCYRKWIIKIVAQCYLHDCHDIVTLCINCHHTYERKHAYALRNQLVEEHQVPHDGTGQKYREMMKVASDCSNLLRYGHLIPQDKTEYLKGRVSEFLERPVTDEDIQSLGTCSKYNIKKLTTYKTHGRLVVEQLANPQEFVERWRAHFISALNPQHMPALWDVKRDLFASNNDTPQETTFQSDEDSHESSVVFERT